MRSLTRPGIRFACSSAPNRASSHSHLPLLVQGASSHSCQAAALSALPRPRTGWLTAGGHTSTCRAAPRCCHRRQRTMSGALDRHEHPATCDDGIGNVVPEILRDNTPGSRSQGGRRQRGGAVSQGLCGQIAVVAGVRKQHEAGRVSAPASDLRCEGDCRVVHRRPPAGGQPRGRRHRGFPGRRRCSRHHREGRRPVPSA